MHELLCKNCIDGCNCNRAFAYQSARTCVACVAIRCSIRGGKRQCNVSYTNCVDVRLDLQEERRKMRHR